MKTRFFRLTIAIITALVGLLLFGGLVSLAASQGAFTGPRAIADSPESDTTIRARRAISIPFGIDETLTLIDNGRTIQVTGPAACQEGGERFKLRVTVTQDKARAKGRTEGSCSLSSWYVAAEAKGPRSFEAEGPAEVCAMAVVFRSQGGSVTQKWCKTVTLE